MKKLSFLLIIISIFQICLLRSESEDDLSPIDLPGIEEQQWKIATPQIEGQITIPFGGVVGRGFLPYFVEIQNVSSSEQEVKIEFEYSGEQASTIKQKFTLSPDQRKEVQLLLPLIFKNRNHFCKKSI